MGKRIKPTKCSRRERLRHVLYNSLLPPWPGPKILPENDLFAGKYTVFGVSCSMVYRTREQLVSTTAHAVYRPGKPLRPKYTLYDLWRLPGYHALSNELDELLERWPFCRARTVALLAVRQAFFLNGATHWEVGAYQEELLVNPDVAARSARERAREAYPGLVAHYAQNLALAEAALVEQQRRKQGSPTGKRSPWRPSNHIPKRIIFA